MVLMFITVPRGTQSPTVAAVGSFFMSECGTHQNCTGAPPRGGDVMLYCGWTDSPNNYEGIDYEAKER